MHVLRFHPGETLVLNFVLPFSPYDVQAVALSFRNGNRVAFETLANTCVPEPQGTSVDEATKCRVGYTITQAESLQFDEFEIYQAQLNVYGPNGSRIASDEIRVETGAQQLIDPSYMSVSVAQATQSGAVVDATNQLSYNDLINKPKINDVILSGNRTLPEQRIPNEFIDQLLADEIEDNTGDTTDDTTGDNAGDTTGENTGDNTGETTEPEEPTDPVEPSEESGGE